VRAFQDRYLWNSACISPIVPGNVPSFCAQNYSIAAVTP
jgi:hypothetical protein